MVFVNVLPKNHLVIYNSTNHSWKLPIPPHHIMYEKNMPNLFTLGFCSQLKKGELRKRFLKR